MIKRISLLITAALMAAMMMVATAAPAFAASPEQRCTDAGGVFSTDPGTKNCTFTEEESAGKNGKGKVFTSETTVSQDGSFSSSHDRVPKGGDCKNPSGGPSSGGTSSENCPEENDGSTI